jgi:hypothetical protein
MRGLLCALRVLIQVEPEPGRNSEIATAGVEKDSRLPRANHRAERFKTKP